MKLHLSKSLRTALLASILTCIAPSAHAVETTTYSTSQTISSVDTNVVVTGVGTVLTATGGNTSGFTPYDATVEAGATLRLTYLDGLGWQNPTDHIILNGSEGATATLEICSRTTLMGELQLNGYTEVAAIETDPRSSLNPYNGSTGISASGKENLISAGITSRHTLSIVVADQGELTLSGYIWKDPSYGGDGAVTKTGAGKFIIADDANSEYANNAVAGSVNRLATVYVNEGELAIERDMTIGSLTMAEGAVTSISDSGSLTLTSAPALNSGAFKGTGALVLDLNADAAFPETFPGEGVHKLSNFDSISYNPTSGDFSEFTGGIEIKSGVLWITNNSTPLASISGLTVSGKGILGVQSTDISSDITITQLDAANNRALSLDGASVVAGTSITLSNLTRSAVLFSQWSGSIHADILGTGDLELASDSRFQLTIGGNINHTGSLTISGGNVVMNNSASSAIGTNVTGITVKDGATLKVNYAEAGKAGRGFYSGTVTVEGGGTLQVTNVDAFGYNDTTATDAVNLQGSTGKTARLKVDARQTMVTNLNLSGNALIEGEGTLQTYGTKVTATNQNNEISAAISTRKALEIEVTNAGDELTLSGALSMADPYEYGGDSTAVREVVTKTGAGTLKIANDGVISDTIVLNVNAGTLDLSAVTTLNAKGLDLATGTTLAVGNYYNMEDTGGNRTGITFTGSLNIAEGVTIDLSSWCGVAATVTRSGTSLASFEAWQPLFTYTGSQETPTFLSDLDGTEVTIKLAGGEADGVTQYEYYRGFLALSENGRSLLLVPEPTTATLSLLALAGLAARRRRP